MNIPLVPLPNPLPVPPCSPLFPLPSSLSDLHYANASMYEYVFLSFSFYFEENRLYLLEKDENLTQLKHRFVGTWAGGSGGL